MVSAQQAAGEVALPNHDEFQDLFTREFDFVCRSLMRLGVPSRDVYDVAQELFLTIHQRLDQWDRRRAIRPWIFAFAARFASNYRRLGWNKQSPLETGGAEPSTSGHEDTLVARDRVLRALDTLSFDQRTVLVMHDLEGFTGAEISELLEVPKFTVHSRVRLAREAFRSAIEATGEAS